MPRYLVVMCDPDTREVHAHVTQAQSEISGLLSHPWVQNTYKDSYITNNLRKDSYEETVENFYECFSWVVSCEDLNAKIMNDLNGGDSSVSSNQLTD